MDEARVIPLHGREDGDGPGRRRPERRPSEAQLDASIHPLHTGLAPAEPTTQPPVPAWERHLGASTWTLPGPPRGPMPPGV